MTADQWALWGCGIYFLTGLLTGVWKYWQVATSEKGRALRRALRYVFPCQNRHLPTKQFDGYKTNL